MRIANDEDTEDPTSSCGDQAVSDLTTGPSAAGPKEPLDGILGNVTVRQKSSRNAQACQPASPVQATGDTRSVAPSPPAPPKTPTCLGRSFDAKVEIFESSIKALKHRDGNLMTSSPTKSRPPFLSKETNIRNFEFKAWDVDERLNEVESQWKAMKEVMNVSMSERKAMEQVVELATSRAEGLQKDREKLDSELAKLRQQVQTLTLDLETERRSHKFDMDSQARDNQHELERLQRELEHQTTRAQRSELEAVEAAERRFRAQLEEERARSERQLDELRSQLGSKQQEASRAMHEKDRDIDEMRSQIERLRGDLDREVTLKDGVQKAVIEMTTANLTLEAQIQQLTGKVRFLESSNQQQSDSFSEMEARLQEALAIAETAREKLIKEETERRVLFNKYQELKGNIRVMCRVRPVLDPSEGAAATLGFPDLKTSAQLDVTGPEERSATGNISRKTMPFEFDRVFTPQTQNEEIFGEISQLVQSALDGYNVCIFCYGQTGSGKTFTMSSADGMIPRAVHMIYDEAERLRDKSWSYQMVGSFVEVYNEELHDLLAAEGSRRKLSIQHDDIRKQTTVVNCRTVPLDSAGRVEQMLEEAQSKRSVAATKANERSSRSHSVFILKLVGENAATGERCEGTLNLVDLAGSERLKHSQVEGDRMRETQNINKSLSCLGDVIEALGKGQGHVPYRNSKLTHLLQYSLGGNSKTLMFVMVSPLEAHLKETITSLRFATKGKVFARLLPFLSSSHGRSLLTTAPQSTTLTSELPSQPRSSEITGNLHNCFPAAYNECRAGVES